MDNLNLTLMNAASPQAALETLTPGASAEQAQKEQFAKDFESILIEKLLEEMKNTIGEWGFEQDGASKQVQGMFWMNLSKDLGKQGGLGIWKDIYQSIDSGQNKTTQTELLDDSL